MSYHLLFSLHLVVLCVSPFYPLSLVRHTTEAVDYRIGTKDEETCTSVAEMDRAVPVTPSWIRAICKARGRSRRRNRTISGAIFLLVDTKPLTTVLLSLLLLFGVELLFLLLLLLMVVVVLSRWSVCDGSGDALNGDVFWPTNRAIVSNARGKSS